MSRGSVVGCCLVLAGLLALAPNASAKGRCGDPAQRPWCDTARSPDERARLLVDRLSRAEKLDLMAGDNATSVVTGNPATGVTNGVPRLGVPTLYHSDGPVGPREGRATAFPSPLTLGAAFDPGLAARVGRAIAEEVKAKGNDLVHAPTVDVMRTPLAGRTFEGYGEDPFLSSRMAVAWIRAAQAAGVVANVKHYAPNSQEGAPPGVPPLTALRGGRTVVDDRVDQRTLREIYLPPFEAAVKDAQVGSVMCAYNYLNGTPACQSRFLLDQVLRREWGFRGFVLSDYAFAVKSTAPSVNNGLEMEMPLGFFYSGAALNLALATGQVSPATIDERVRNIMRPLFRLGFFDRASYRADDGAIDKRAHATVARTSLERGSVLLRNRRLLPLDSRRLRTIAIIGKEATELKNGGGSSAVRPFAFSSPRQAIAARAGPGVRIRYDDGSDRTAAARTARGADVAIVFGSDNATEGVDKSCLSLSCAPREGDDDRVIDAVAAANPRTVAVLQTAGPVLTPWRGRVRAILETWYPGQESGAALARMLFGDTEPGGRLPLTFPRRAGDPPTSGDPQAYPGVNNEVRFKEGVLVGYRWYDRRGIAPAFPFGFGLSYTRFRYSGIRVARGAVSAVVKNVGTRTGSEVAQLYMGIPSPRRGIVEPPRQLKGFQRVRIAPGESKRVRFPLDARSFAYWDTRGGRWAVAPGCYDAAVGSSSRSLPLHRFIEQRSLYAVGVRPRRRGLAFAFAGRGRVDAAVFRVARGRRISRPRLLARFADRDRPFAWDGRSRSGKRVRDGWYVARLRVRDADGTIRARRSAFKRSRGRFARRAGLESTSGCRLLAAARLASPVFGGRRGIRMRLAVRVRDDARIKVVVRRGRRLVRRFGVQTLAAGRTLTLAMSGKRLRRGRYAVLVRVRRGGELVRTRLVARRL